MTRRRARRRGHTAPARPADPRRRSRRRSPCAPPVKFGKYSSSSGKLGPVEYDVTQSSDRIRSDERTTKSLTVLLSDVVPLKRQDFPRNREEFLETIVSYDKYFKVVTDKQKRILRRKPDLQPPSSFQRRQIALYNIKMYIKEIFKELTSLRLPNDKRQKTSVANVDKYTIVNDWDFSFKPYENAYEFQIFDDLSYLFELSDDQTRGLSERKKLTNPQTKIAYINKDEHVYLDIDPTEQADRYYVDTKNISLPSNRLKELIDRCDDDSSCFSGDEETEAHRILKDMKQQLEFVLKNNNIKLTKDKEFSINNIVKLFEKHQQTLNEHFEELQNKKDELEEIKRDKKARYNLRVPFKELKVGINFNNKGLTNVPKQQLIKSWVDSLFHMWAISDKPEDRVNLQFAYKELSAFYDLLLEMDWNIYEKKLERTSALDKEKNNLVFKINESAITPECEEFLLDIFKKIHTAKEINLSKGENPDEKIVAIYNTPIKLLIKIIQKVQKILNDPSILDKSPYSSVSSMTMRTQTHISGNEPMIDDENGIIFSRRTENTRFDPKDEGKNPPKKGNKELPWVNTHKEYIREYIFKKIIKDEKTKENLFDLLLIDGVLEVNESNVTERYLQYKWSGLEKRYVLKNTYDTIEYPSFSDLIQFRLKNPEEDKENLKNFYREFRNNPTANEDMYRKYFEVPDVRKNMEKYEITLRNKLVSIQVDPRDKAQLRTKFKKIKCNTKKVNKLKHAWSNTKRANRERLNVLKKSKAWTRLKETLFSNVPMLGPRKFVIKRTVRRLPHTHKVKNTFTRKQKRMHTFDKDPPEEEIDVDL